MGYLAAIVAASNAGGAGSVVGDTTTTMMWVSGVSPLSLLEAYVAAIVAFLIFAVPASLQQQRHSPLINQAGRQLTIDWTRVFIVAAMLIAALGANVVTNLYFPELLGRVPVLVYPFGWCFLRPHLCGDQTGACYRRLSKAQCF
jgi:Na+/H+ antiporter NhaD/arsenite permease-like protein